MGPIDVATSCNAHGGPCGRLDFESETFITQTVATLDAQYGKLQGCSGQDALHGHSHLIPETAHSLRADGLDCGDLSPTLRGMGHDSSHANAGGQVAIAIQERVISENPGNGPDGVGVRTDDTAYTVEARQVTQAVAFESRFARNGRGAPSELVPPLKAQSGQTGKGDAAPLTMHGMAVRRLTPTECERLQGLPDNWTLVPYHGAPMKDAPRYKMIGNGFAIPCVSWIGSRIQMVEDLKP